MEGKGLFLGIDHIGINSENSQQAIDTARTFSSIFGFEVNRGKDSTFAGSSIEIMNDHGGRGKHGHIAVLTEDIHRARTLLEDRGIGFDPDSAKYDESGNMIVLYMKYEIAGFAIHLLQCVVSN
jgi:2-dehydro-3-deoxyphosphogluconate aldolase / (4S)-4-hydroxy-2-oxoglutarate aldolase